MRADTTVVTIPHCGHVCSVERPREFNRFLGEFLKSHRGQPMTGAVR